MFHLWDVDPSTTVPLMEHTSTPTATETVAANVRAELARRRISAQTFAAAMGWSKATTSRRLDGANRWTVDDVQAAADYLGVTPSLLTADGVAA